MGVGFSLYPSRVLFENLVLFLFYIMLFTDRKKKKSKILVSFFALVGDKVLYREWSFDLSWVY